MKLPFFQSRTDFSKTNLVKNPQATQLEVDKWLLSRFVMEVLVPAVGIKPFPLDELMMLSGTLLRFKPKYVFEWGTHKGISARVFHETTSAFGLDSVIYSVDLPDEATHVEHPGNQRGEMVRGLERVHLFQGDGVTTSLEILSKLADNESVLFFLDGDHAYLSVKRELNMIFKQVKEPLILVHDTFYQSKESNYNTGPFRAIEKVVDRKKFNVISTNLGLPGMSLILPR